MSEKWTPEQVRSRLRETQEKILNFDYPIARQEWADIELERYMDISEALCDTIESQRLELEAAKRVLAASSEVVDTWLSIRRETREFEDWMSNLCEAVHDYDALRSNATGGEEYSDG